MNPQRAAPHSIEDWRHGYEEESRLRGFRSGCGFRTATWGLVCPRCGQRDLVEVDLSSRGKITAYSVQTVPSDEFVNEAPYAYVVVDMDDGSRLTGWMPGIAREADLAIGMPVHYGRSYKAGAQIARDSVAAPET